MSATTLKSLFRSLFGHTEDTSGTLATDVKRVFQREINYEWPNSVKAAAVANPATRMEAQTGSLSLSQPIGERVIFTAVKPCEVVDLSFAQAVSSTVTATYTMCWTMQVIKRGKGTGTFSNGSWSVTKFVGGLTSSTAAGSHSFTGSYSSLRQNVAFAPNKLCLSKTNANISLKRGDSLVAKVKKGSGTATDSGALFRGGLLKIVVEEE